MSSMSVLMFRRLRQVSARDGRNPRMNRHLNEVDNGRHAREERGRSVPRGAIKKVLPEHFLSEEAVGRRFTAGVSRRCGSERRLANSSSDGNNFGCTAAAAAPILRIRGPDAVDNYRPTL